MARIKHFSLTPPGGWRYVQPETGARFESDLFRTLCAAVRQHREYKGLPLDTLEADIERQLCSGLTLEHCKPDPGEIYRPVRDLSAELTAGLALSLGKAVTAFLATGGQLVEKSISESRAATCRGCPFNKPAKLCSCSSVYGVVERLVPADRKEPGISVCMACGCSLQAKVLLPAEVIAASLPEEVVLPEWCWQRVGK